MLGQLIRNFAIAALFLWAALAIKLGWLADFGIDYREQIEDRRWLQLMLDALISGLPIVIVLDVFLKWNQLKQVNSTIIGTLLKIYGGAEQEIFSQLPDDEKQRIVRKSVVNILGNEYGSVLFDEILAPYLDKEINYRDSFQYHIACNDSLKIADNKVANSNVVREFLALTRDDYIWVSQSLTYTRFSATDNKQIPHLIARFTFSQDQLNQFIVTDELFFREIIRVPERVSTLLTQMSEKQLREFLRDVLGFRVFSPDGVTALSHTAHWIVDHSTHEKFIEIRIANPTNAYQGSGCRLEFTLPHDKFEKEFLVTMPVPTKSGAEVSFTKSPSMKNLSYIPFISSFRHKNYEATHHTATPSDSDGPDTINIRLTGWSFPTSGMVFVWD